MANKVTGEYFKNALIDTQDMTITEFDKDAARTYDLLDVLRRWDGVPDVNISIERSIGLPPTYKGV